MVASLPLWFQELGNKKIYKQCDTPDATAVVVVEKKGRRRNKAVIKEMSHLIAPFRLHR